MSKIICPKCHQPSFSSSEMDNWICPICSNENTTSQITESLKLSKPQFFILKNSYIQQNPDINKKIRTYVFQSFD